MATTSGSESKSGTGSSRSESGGRAGNGAGNGRTTNGSGTTNGRTTNGSGTTVGRTTGTAKATAAAKARRARASAASATGATARARIASARSKSGRATAGRTKPKRDDIPIVEPTTVPADDSVLAATNAQRALQPDMRRVAWLRTQFTQMEQRQRDRLTKVAQLTVIAIVFITFVLQNATGVNVHFLFFSLNIRLIWVIFGCAVLGAAAGYLIGRPDKSLRALFPQKPPKKQPTTTP